MTTHMRVYYAKAGGHYHCRVFTAKASNLTHANCGTLVFVEEEWEGVQRLMQGAEFVPE